MIITKERMRELKIQMVKDMDTYIRNLNDENALDEWLMEGVPDGAEEDDYIGFAENQEDWVDLCALFGRLTRMFGKYGEAV